MRQSDYSEMMKLTDRYIDYFYQKYSAFLSRDFDREDMRQEVFCKFFNEKSPYNTFSEEKTYSSFNGGRADLKYFIALCVKRVYLDKISYLKADRRKCNSESVSIHKEVEGTDCCLEEVLYNYQFKTDICLEYAFLDFLSEDSPMDYRDLIGLSPVIGKMSFSERNLFLHVYLGYSVKTIVQMYSEEETPIKYVVNKLIRRAKKKLKEVMFKNPECLLSSV